ncbi:hypothetical protein PsorP6_016580 [Peronosclerospora sorghi]|uniref:Uncharacterized protein n=1 Tax=Peronosclerospora sorghi TaxID=230839 RepID=A0ACC0VJX2_9STRA|nr:hypothetical protein PsorP6_016580 [Peronosclerospora sorghi]
MFWLGFIRHPTRHGPIHVIEIFTLRALVWVESECRFQLATVAAVGATGETCQVAYRNTMPPVECSLDHVMVLEIPPWVGKKESCVETPKLALTTLRRREEEEYSTFAPPKPLDPIRDRSRDQKVRAVVAVKALLHRKERILSAMASLNERVAHDQKRLCEQSASLWTIPIAFSNDVASRERRHVQTQHAWLAANLKATNEHLQSALLHLQSFSTTNSSEPAPFDPNGAYDSDAMVGVNQDASETLTQSQLRWALDFLAASRQQASLMVEEAAARFALEDPDRARSSGGGPEIRFESVLPETRHLVAHCVTLMSILRAASVDVSPLVTQKLVDRALELLKPSHDANLDLYAEVYAAAHTLGAENPK